MCFLVAKHHHFVEVWQQQSHLRGRSLFPLNPGRRDEGLFLGGSNRERTLPNILLAGVCANVSTRHISRGRGTVRRYFAILLWTKYKTQRAAWIENYPRGGGGAGRGKMSFKKILGMKAGGEKKYDDMLWYQIKVAISFWVQMNFSFWSKCNLSPDREEELGEG